MKTLGIRKELKNRWEKRVPLNPLAVRSLVEDGYRVIIQPSEIRIYDNDQYESAGAIISEDLSSSDLILGVKELPVSDIIPGIPHLFFSHTIKGQEYNMPLLRKFLDTGTTLLDYELIADSKDKRLVFFGKFAGNAGMVDTLWGLGQRLKLQYDLDTPLMKVKRAFEYDSVAAAVEHLTPIGREIDKNGLPDEIVPLNIFLMGYGHVAEGCREILSALPIEEVDPDNFFTDYRNRKNNRIYLSVFREKNMAERKGGEPFDLQHYYHHKELYRSRMEKFLPYCSVYMNAIYWTRGYPIFLSRESLRDFQANDGKMIIIGDITCDINGSVAATVRATDPDNPIYIYDAVTGNAVTGLVGKGIANCAVDNFPCEFSREASDFFTRTLLPYMEPMLLNDYSKPMLKSSLPEEIKKACITHLGELQSGFEYLKEYL